MAIEEALKSLEEKVDALAAAVAKNTEAHDALAEVARAASGGTPTHRPSYLM